MKKLFTILIIITTFAVLYSADQAGVISDYNGRISIFEGDSPRAKNISKKNTPVFLNNKIATKSKSSAIIDLVNGDRIALSEKSTMSILGPEEFKPWDGKVVFKIKKRGGVSGVKVALTSATIGVKGTQFLIDAEKSSGKYDVFLKEGKIECTPIEGQFKMYKEVEMSEYEAYQKKMAGEYEDYVKKLEEEFVEFVDSFVMEPGDAFTVSGQEVRKLEFTPEIDKAFNIFDELENETAEYEQTTHEEEAITDKDDSEHKQIPDDNGSMQSAPVPAPQSKPMDMQPENSETRKDLLDADFENGFDDDFDKEFDKEYE